MAMSTILPQSAPPAYSALSAVAYALQQNHVADSAYGLPFTRALDRAVQYVGKGIHYESCNATHYRIQSHSRPWLWYYVTLDHCQCEHQTPWCWRRALLHLLTAAQSLTCLDRCPRPTLAYVPARHPKDMATILREADELY